jgi:hypothetical protein
VSEFAFLVLVRRSLPPSWETILFILACSMLMNKEALIARFTADNKHCKTLTTATGRCTCIYDKDRDESALDTDQMLGIDVKGGGSFERQ